MSALQMNNDMIDLIISFLPLNQQAKISQRHYNQVAPLAINRIIKSIKYNKMRMLNIMGGVLSYSDELKEAYYMIYFPKDLRYKYIRASIIAMYSRGAEIPSITNELHDKILGSALINTTEISTNQLFKQIVTSLNVYAHILCMEEMNELEAEGDDYDQEADDQARADALAWLQANR